MWLCFASSASLGVFLETSSAIPNILKNHPDKAVLRTKNPLIIGLHSSWLLTTCSILPSTFGINPISLALQFLTCTMPPIHWSVKFAEPHLPKVLCEIIATAMGFPIYDGHLTQLNKDT
jgi:hypothetical protein